MPKGKKGQKGRQAHGRRKADPKTPAAQVGSDAAYPDDEPEEEVNEGAMALSSQPSHAGGDGITRHLGSDLPDVLPSSPSVQLQQDERDNMGAEQSREAYSKNIRHTAQQLRSDSQTADADRKMTGKLKRPSSSFAQSSRNRATARKLGTANGIRKSAYDLAGSPEKTLRPPKQPPNPNAFSPLRQQKAQRQNEQTGQSPRRSGRVRAQQGKDEAEVRASGADRIVQAPNSEDAIHRDFFPDAVVRQHVPDGTDANGGADMDEDVDVAVVDGADRTQQLAQGQPTTEAVKRKPGRPPKNGQSAKPPTASQKSTAPRAAKETPKKQAAAGEGAPRLSQSSVPAQQQLAKLRFKNDKSKKAEVEQEPRNQSKEPEDSPERRKSARHSERLQDLRHRRDTEDAPSEPPASAGGEAEPEADAADEEEELHAKPVTAKAVIVRPSDVPFSGNNQESENVNDTGESSAQVTAAGKKRKASQNAANTAAKRRRRSASEDSECDTQDEPEGDEPSQPIGRRLWGQWSALKTIYENLNHVGCNTIDGERLMQNNIDLEDEDVADIKKLCTEAKKRYRSIRNGSSDSDFEPANVLQQISQRIDGLRGRNEDFPTDFRNKAKTTEIYFHLIPALVKLIWRAATCYVAIDAEEAPNGEITMDHLANAQEIVQLTLDMEFAAKTLYKARPDSSDAVVKPVHNEIAVPLTKVSHIFQRVLQRHQANVRATQRRQDEAEHRALQLEQEERRSRQAAELARIRQKWEGLHWERMACEGGIMRPAKAAHLRMPDTDLDEDYNGTPYHRVQLFQPRVGPPPGLVDRASQLLWTEGELRALEDGLMNYAGPMVFERLFREWCPRGRMLNGFNVTEIVTTAAMMRDAFVAQAELAGREVPGWVRGIPVWTKGHAGMGKENDGAVEAEVDGDAEEGDDAGTVAAVASSSR